MRKTLGIALTAFAIFFSVPTGVILASWNALPGDTLYTTKRAMESAALSLVKSTPLASNFSVSFTDRRFKEADKLLSKKGSTVGYALLVEQAQQTKEIIVEQKNTQEAIQLVANIEQYQKLIETKKTTLIAQTQQFNPQPSFATNQPTYTSAPTQTTIKPNQPLETALPTSIPNLQPATAQPLVEKPVEIPELTQSVGETIIQLDQTKKHLEKIKNEIETELPTSDKTENKGKNERD